MDASNWDERYSASELVWGVDPNRYVKFWATEVAEEITDEDPSASLCALDIGCGEGRNAIWMVANGWQVDAFDFSAVAIERLSQLAENVLELEQQAALIAGVQDISEWEPLAPMYDFVVICFLHFPQQQLQQLWEKSAAALKPGGSLLVIGHDKKNLAEGVGGPQDENVLFHAAECGEYLSKVGLDVEHAHVHQREVPDQDRPALDAVIFARKP